MKHTTHEPHTEALAPLPAVRHDGWTGEKMAIFLETLAETGIVADACDAARMGPSGAYAARRRNAGFAAAWDAALTIARERLADTLLARSIEGNVEQIWRDGELVGERHVIDNRLGLAMLRRFDRLAETGSATTAAGRHGPSVAAGRAPAPRAQGFDWEVALAALRSGDPDDLARALAMVRPLKGGEVDEVDTPPFSHADEGADPVAGRCWWDDDAEVWMTDFPPPPGFDGDQDGVYDRDGMSYSRECSAEEAALLEADRTAAAAEQRAEDETLRDSWFAALREEFGPAE